MIARLSPIIRYEREVSDTPWTALQRSAHRMDTELPHGTELSATGLYLPEKLDVDQWTNVGRKLMAIEKGIQWALGDWWAYGHHAYGERVAKAKGLPYATGTLMNYGRVARKVPTSLRNEALSFSHHEVVAMLEPDQQKRWLHLAARKNWPVAKFRRQIDEGTNDGESDPAQNARIWAIQFIDEASRPIISRSAIIRDAGNTLQSLSDGTLEQMSNAARDSAQQWSCVHQAIEQYRFSRREKPGVRERLPGDKVNKARRLSGCREASE
ncbi:hypothetical protein GA0061098_1015112 [Bradyrhizobium shewense]|uniref:Uncharacterized protein n=1 Tax=Bradyrhizobium shewense TaxID=1761772 RepID=A0A1C3XG42_9BRAD|nr:hypothetical protein [Bradyrhizobium shewense]SCB51233.1 hypothetical protein GA0061098_1015112 [Bradyrhizobium shewense]